MDLPKVIILGGCAIVAIYVGIRTVIAKRLPVVYEGDDKPLGWIKGWEAVAVGAITCAFGVTVLLDVFGVIHIL